MGYRDIALLSMLASGPEPLGVPHSQDLVEFVSAESGGSSTDRRAANRFHWGGQSSPRFHPLLHVRVAAALRLLEASRGLSTHRSYLNGEEEP